MAAPKPNTALATTNANTGMELPDYLREENSGAGLEGLDRNELQLPRIGLAQGLSPQLDPGKPEYIDGLRLGDMFNSVTGEIYGRGPLYFTVFRIEPPRHIEFNPRDQGGGIKDFNVPANDPRTLFTTNEETGERVPPKATKFLDFLIGFLPLPVDNPAAAMKNVIGLSCKGMNLKVAKHLNSLLFYRSPKPTFAGRFRLTTGSETNKKGTYNVFVIENAGPDEGGGWITDANEFAISKAIFEDLKTAKVTVDRDAGPEGEGGDGDGPTF